MYSKNPLIESAAWNGSMVAYNAMNISNYSKAIQAMIPVTDKNQAIMILSTYCPGVNITPADLAQKKQFSKFGQAVSPRKAFYMALNSSDDINVWKPAVMARLKLLHQSSVTNTAYHGTNMLARN